MEIPIEEHGVEWLRESLQAAIELEFATVPVYLCGMWSIKDQGNPVRGTIRSVVIDEMFHMGLACNMLTTIRGTPEVHTQRVIPK
jgi:rubrerythrin